MIFFSIIIGQEFINGILYYDISDHLPVFTIAKQLDQNAKTQLKQLIHEEKKPNITLNY